MTLSRKTTWRPTSLTKLYLSFVIIISLLLIVLLQSLLLQAQQNNGLIFAIDIHALPLQQTFVYLYLPTVVFVAYGFLWAWLDLDVRRLEPWYQLSREGGASGAASLLLDYPVQFILTVPVNSFRNGHWTVFLVSLGTLLALWGLIPVQAGIFAVQTVNRTIDAPFARSTGYTPIAHQPTTFSAEAMQSVASVLWLNESLREFMTRDYVLAPFLPIGVSSTRSAAETWTHSTERYGLDLSCETPTIYTINQTMYMNSSWGCSFFVPSPRPDRNTIDDNSKIYDTQYIGYYNADGRAQYWLEREQSCPPQHSNTFIMSWSKALVGGTNYSSMNWNQRLANANVTTRYCRPSYYVQDVVATVSAAPGHAVHSIVELGQKRAMPDDLFNRTLFELALNIDVNFPGPRNNFPTTSWPSQKSFLVDTQFNLNNVPPVTPYALGAVQRPMEDYLDPVVLDSSYQSALRLMFARWLFDILSRKMDPRAITGGQQTITTQAVTMVPTFTYIVEGMLGLIAILTAILMQQIHRRPCKLKSDPASISTLMRISSKDETLLNRLAHLDRADTKELYGALANLRFVLEADEKNTAGCRLTIVDPHGEGSTEYTSKASNRLFRGVRPWELTMRFGLSFLLVQIAMLAASVLLFKHSGQIIPPGNTLLRRVLESYIPVALGTLIEPLWLVLYRQLCALQPFEALRVGSADPAKSIDLTYSMSPPQIAWWRAIRNKHILLAVVGAMPLLANLFSVALNGLLFEDTAISSSSIPVNLTHQLEFLPINGSALPFLPVVGLVPETWYIATSNLTTSTPMPPWTDDQFSYIPFNISDAIKSSNRTYKAQTYAFGSNLKCQSIDAKKSLVINGSQLHEQIETRIDTPVSLNVSLMMDDKSIANCVAASDSRFDVVAFISNYSGPAAWELNYPLDSPTTNRPSSEMEFCRKHITTGWVRANVQQQITPLASNNSNLTFGMNFWDATLLACRVDLTHGLTELTVDHNGYVVSSRNFQPANNSAEDLFFASNSTSADLLAQMHYYIIDVTQQWHTDAYPSDFMNYLMRTQWNDSSAIDYKLPPPAAEVWIPRYEALYNKLFAIFISRNRGSLLKSNNISVIDTKLARSRDSASSTPRTVMGTILENEVRVFVNFGFFIIVVAVLCMYILAAITLFSSRPWQVLARLPDTPASIIAYFAASRAVREIGQAIDHQTFIPKDPLRSDTQNYILKSGLMHASHKPSAVTVSTTEIEKREYGFGSFLDQSGIVRIGIEFDRFVRPLTKVRGIAPTDESEDRSDSTGRMKALKRSDYRIPDLNRQSYQVMVQGIDETSGGSLSK